MRSLDLTLGMHFRHSMGRRPRNPEVFSAACPSCYGEAHGGSHWFPGGFLGRYSKFSQMCWAAMRPEFTLLPWQEAGMFIVYVSR